MDREIPPVASLFSGKNRSNALVARFPFSPQIHLEIMLFEDDDDPNGGDVDLAQEGPNDNNNYDYYSVVALAAKMKCR